MSDSLTLYGPAFSPFVRVVRLFAAELGTKLPCGMSPYGDKIPSRSDGHLALNPFGKLPVLIDGDFTVFETAAICRYLDQRLADGKVHAALPVKQRALVEQWAGAICMYGRLNVMDGFLLELAFPKGEDGRPRMDIVLENLPAARAFVAIMERQLQQGSWIAGDEYSFADSALTPFLDYLSTVPALDAEGEMIAGDSACADFLERVKSRDSAWVLTER